MNYILLITLIVSAGDGKSWPAAKGRYKYSQHEEKKFPKPQQCSFLLKASKP